MDKSGVESKLLANGNQEQGEIDGGKVEEDEDDESKKLLLPKKGGLSKKSGKKQRKVQWNDRHGYDLTEVLEYQPRMKSVVEVFGCNKTHHYKYPHREMPHHHCNISIQQKCSEVSDSEDDDSDACICNIM